VNKTPLLTARDIDRIISRMAHEITEKPSFSSQNTALVGIRTRGIYLANRLQNKIKAIENVTLEVGALDISFHRDDLDRRATLPQVGTTEIPFSLDGKNIILVDDVLYSGRTVRAALDELCDYGRPDRIQLAVLIDRGHRELPIRADIVGKNVPTHEQDKIQVTLEELDTHDEVVLLCP
jgi:pyrimidine operon attenuation protein/uracil phosphoribosyltransferase